MPILKHAWAHGLSESLFYLGLINMNNRTRAAKKIVTEMVIYRADDGTRSSSDRRPPRLLHSSKTYYNFRYENHTPKRSCTSNGTQHM